MSIVSQWNLKPNSWIYFLLLFFFFPDVSQLVLELANSNHLRKALLQAWASLVPGGLDAMTIDSGYAFSVPCRSLAIHSFPP